jgi:acetyl/propionyl-CoA carboxylase alpha subunit
VEFLLTDGGEFFFLEMNTRLQVEHPVTEAITGRDLVEDQLRIAAGEPVMAAGAAPIGHAIEARLYAEDPDAGFLPAAGRLARVRWPDGVRLDTAVAEGDIVSDRYDPLLAKLIAHGPTRAAALAALRVALDRTQLLGVRTNLRFLRWLMVQRVMTAGQMRTDTLASLPLPGPPEASAEAWVDAARSLRGAEAGESWRGGWRLAAPAAVRLLLGDEERRVEPSGGVNPDVAVVDGAAFVDVDGQSLEFSVALPPSVEEAARHAAAHAGASAALVSPMPGRVIAVRALVGDPVRAHQAVVVIEAMKMEHAVITPLAGRLTAVHVGIGQQVQRGDLLAEVSA